MKTREEDERNTPKYVVIDDYPWPPVWQPDAVRSALRYEPDPDDVFVNSYPKCGTTWVQNICLELMYGKSPAAGGQELLLLSPMLDYVGAEEVKKLPRPRLIKTHFRYGQMNFAAADKILLVVRNPKDCLVSYFYHHKAFKQYEFENGSFDDFYDLFVHRANQQLGHADYFDFHESWLPHLDDNNVLLLVYEQMLLDLPLAVRRIAKFLGGAAKERADDPALFGQIVERCTLKEMKGDDSRFFPAEILTGATPFIRKGVAKDWVNHLT
uniref:Sulfotransferase domain-containing protein n=1 Tax=Plectus sambesii TaxID=2011161 RepID=A0A914W975_9BILA